MQPELVILVGNIGSGKSTASKEYASKGYRIICRDALRTMIGAGNYVFEQTIEHVIDDASVALFESLLQQKQNIVIDETNVDRHTRKRYVKWGKIFGYKVTACVMPNLTASECLLNREKDSLRGTDKLVWAEVWSKFNKRYNEPTYAEGFDEIIKREKL